MTDDEWHRRRAALKARERELDAARDPGAIPSGHATEEEIEAEAIEACRRLSEEP